jgi:hypothetical protein
MQCITLECKGEPDRIGEDTGGRPYFFCAECGTEFQTDPDPGDSNPDAQTIEALRGELEAADIALTNMLQLFSDRQLGDAARAKVRILRDRIRARLA